MAEVQPVRLAHKIPPNSCAHEGYGLKCDEFDRLMAVADGMCHLCRELALN